MSDPKLKLEIVEKFSTLVTAGFGLVAALAWNSAIQSLVNQIFRTASGLVAQFIYAIIITLLVIYLTYRIGRLSERLKHSLGGEEKKQ